MIYLISAHPEIKIPDESCQRLAISFQKNLLKMAFDVCYSGISKQLFQKSQEQEAKK